VSSRATGSTGQFRRAPGQSPDALEAGTASGALTPEAVWDALAEIPDPEIPVISLVELGVIRDVEVENGRVRVEFTPTFLGCPALEVMRDQMSAKVRELGAEPEIEVIVDDSWSTDRITPEGREKLREAGLAPPAPRTAGMPQLVELQRGPFRCPYCGSTETQLENIFGPTPCRSLRYCKSCRQPFEQFKTI
jgi:ring-1,2-phenylacetyl-CoA epoxidase subunit PaaD